MRIPIRVNLLCTLKQEAPFNEGYYIFFDEIRIGPVPLEIADQYITGKKYEAVITEAKEK